MKNKGFTLVELLAVIAILAVIIVIAYPVVTNVITNSKEKSYNNQVALIEEATRIYLAKVPDSVSPLQNSGDTLEITLQDLIDNDCIKENVVDPRTDEVIETSSIIIVTLDNNGTYTSEYVGSPEVTELFDYTGSVQSFTVPYNGDYKLQVWGAQGGENKSKAGGKGGYSEGVVTLTKTTTLYIYVGGEGIENTADTGWGTINGGWNGGGGVRRYTNKSASGGGATDISLVGGEPTLDSFYRYARTEASYKSRIIVAGGGGGRQSDNGTTPGYGGGTNGGGSSSRSGGIVQSAQSNVLTGGYGTQTVGGNAELYPSDYNDYASSSAQGSFGLGGTYYSNHTSNTGAAGGGGGWYGGGVNCHGSGGGGSAFVWTAATAGNVPAGYSVSTDYYLESAQTIAGNAEMPSTDGNTETGHEGNGYAIITRVFD